MEYRAHDELAQVARLYRGGLPEKPMSRYERLLRWVELLNGQSRRRLGTLYETEFQPRRVREAMRGDNTAITVAFEDPVLRAEGLLGDTYGDAKRFFGLSDRQIHLALCYCHSGMEISAGSAARRLETYLPRLRRPGLFCRMARTLSRRS